MEIKGKVHCFFEQSGTFKNEFIKLGIPAEDYDIQNNFGQTDHITDLFKSIEDAYDGQPSVFDQIRGGAGWRFNIGILSLYLLFRYVTDTAYMGSISKTRGYGCNICYS